MTNPAWRLLQTPPASGAWNMAVDEALLVSVAAREAPPTVRFYGWQPPCLSLGYFQPVDEIDEAECTRRAIDLVRRPTGGSAILHADELTYSLAVPENDPHVSGDILTSYHGISLVLARGLADLGLQVRLAPLPSGPESPEPGESFASGARGSRPAPCFIRPARHEILAGGKKLVGSAQVRRGGAVLQHGAIPLGGDVTAITRLLAMDEPRRIATARRLREGAATVREAAGHRLSFKEVAASLARAFGAVWQIDLHASPLLDSEVALAARMSADRYANASWTHAR
jgi:lipoyl(octanoyl) transferase